MNSFSLGPDLWIGIFSETATGCGESRSDRNYHLTKVGCASTRTFYVGFSENAIKAFFRVAVLDVYTMEEVEATGYELTRSSARDDGLIELYLVNAGATIRGVMAGG